MNARRIFDPCWDAHVDLIWPADAAALNKYITRHFADYETDNDIFAGKTVQYMDARRGQVIILALQDWRRSDDRWVAVLAHECLHASHYILCHRGMRLTDDTAEAYAYLLGSLFRRCLGHLQDKPRGPQHRRHAVV